MAFINPVTSNFNSFFDYDYSFSSVPDEEKKDDPLQALLDVRASEAVMEDLKLTQLLSQAQAKYPGMNITR